MFTFTLRIIGSRSALKNSLKNYHHTAQCCTAKEVVVLSAVRTPIGSFRGALVSKTAVQLGSVAIQQAIKASSVNHSDIGEIIMGCVFQAGCGQAPGRHASILAGVPLSIDCTTINKACASSLKAIMMGSEAIRSSTHNVVVAGGFESTSNAPFLVSREAPTYGGSMMQDHVIYDGLMCVINKIHMGACTDILAKRVNITRQEQDDYAISSYKRAAEAWKNNIFSNEIVPVPIFDKKSNTTVYVTEDEEYKKVMLDKIPKLKPAFTPTGTITAANASKLNDGAASVVIASADFAKQKGLKPLAKIIAFADGSCEPVDFGRAPVIAIKKVLEKANLKLEDISLFEINEAFSVVPLVCIKELGIDPTKVNIHGGAVSLGHPAGASGARILTHLIYSLENAKYGIAAICNGAGGSSAMLISKCAN